MPSRQFHSKRRNGCQTCKAKKIRCDLGQPVCKNCTRLNRHCSYSTSVGFSTISPRMQATEPETSKTNPNVPSSEDPSVPHHLATRDLELMHHYSTIVCYTLTDDPKNYPVWKSAIPKHAFSYSFLLHGILAVSALHKRLQADAQDWPALTEDARIHQQTALSQCIPLLRNVNEENCHALFAFPPVLAVTSYAFLQTSDKQLAGEDVIHGVIDVYDLLNGAPIIAALGKDWLRQGDLSPMMPPWPSFDTALDQCNPEARASLEAILAFATLTEGENSVYPSAIQSLALMFPSAGHPDIGRLIGWPIHAGAGYLAQLKRRKALALVLLAHYGAALHVARHFWYLGDLGTRLIEAVSDGLDDHWRGYLDWPIRTANMGV